MAIHMTQQVGRDMGRLIGTAFLIVMVGILVGGLYYWAAGDAYHYTGELMLTQAQYQQLEDEGRVSEDDIVIAAADSVIVNLDTVSSDPYFEWGNRDGGNRKGQNAKSLALTTMIVIASAWFLWVLFKKHRERREMGGY